MYGYGGYGKRNHFLCGNITENTADHWGIVEMVVIRTLRNFDLDTQATQVPQRYLKWYWKAERGFWRNEHADITSKQLHKKNQKDWNYATLVPAKYQKNTHWVYDRRKRCRRKEIPATTHLKAGETAPNDGLWEWQQAQSPPRHRWDYLRSEMTKKGHRMRLQEIGGGCFGDNKYTLEI